MFCPKCGTENPETGKFCRSCGIDLGNVSEALTGNLKKPIELLDRKGKPIGWEGAIGKISTGAAFLTVAVILGISNAAGGRNWWFWMLIPALTMIGAGVAHIIRIQEARKSGAFFGSPDQRPIIVQAPKENTLPPPQTDFVKPPSIYETGDLSMRPPSVTEGTTRHLEMNTEGETMTLPKK
jgi:hypothetical protein